MAYSLNSRSFISIPGEKREHPDIISDWYEIGFTFDSSVIPRVSRFHFHFVDQQPEFKDEDLMIFFANKNVTEMIGKPWQVFDVRPRVIPQHIDETTGQKAVGPSRVRIDARQIHVR